MAATPAAHLDLWRYLLDIDLMARVESWNVAVDDPILLAVAEPRKLGMALGDALWLRIVDLSVGAGRAPLPGRRPAGARGRRRVLPLERRPLGADASRAACRSSSRRPMRRTSRAT